MKFVFQITIGITLLHSCYNSDNSISKITSTPNPNSITQNIEIKIAENSNNYIFLHFWPEMSYDEFEEVLKVEEQIGTLENERFILFISEESARSIKLDFKNRNTLIPSNSGYYSINSSSISVPFDIYFLRKSCIVLKYKDEYWGEISSNIFSIPYDTEDYMERYEIIAKYLKRYFNNNYELIGERVSIDNKYYDLVWHDNEMNRAILLNSSYWYANNDGFSSFSVHTKTIKKTRYALWAHADFEITYMSFKRYLILKEKADKEKELKEQEQIQIDQTKQQINRNL